MLRMTSTEEETETAAALCRAIILAAVAHTGQLDKNGAPAIRHALRVTEDVARRGGSLAQQMAAALHDVVEDTRFELADIERSCPEATILVDALTHRDSETYMEYIQRLAGTPGAILIKLADIDDNLQRIEQLGHADEREMLRKRYLKAQAYLKERILLKEQTPNAVV